MARAPREYRSHRNTAVPMPGASFGSDNPPRSRSAAGSGWRRRPQATAPEMLPPLRRGPHGHAGVFLCVAIPRARIPITTGTLSRTARSGERPIRPPPTPAAPGGLQQTKQIRRADAVALKHLATKLQPMPHVTEIQGFAPASAAMTHGSGARLRVGAIPHHPPLQPARRRVTHYRNGPRTCREDTARVPGLAIAPEGTACAHRCI